MALNENRLDVAERLLKPHLKEDPFDVARDPHAGRAGGADRAADSDAENLLRRAVEIAPGFTAARANLALVLGRHGPAGRSAASCSTRCSTAEPDDDRALNLKAATLGRLGDFDEAIQLYEDVLDAAADAAARVAELWPYAEDGRPAGRRHRRLSQGDRAQADARRSLVEPRQPQDGQVRRRTTSRRCRPRSSSADLERRGPASTSISRSARRCTTPAQTDEAFAPLCGRQCAAAEAASRSTPDKISRIGRPQHRAVHRRDARERPGGCDAPDPIFIVGMPRAGSTLVEQILSSHSLVEGTSELPDIPALARRAAAAIRATCSS